MTDAELITKYAPGTEHHVEIRASWEFVRLIGDVLRLTIRSINYFDDGGLRSRMYVFENGRYTFCIPESEIRAAENQSRPIVFELGHVSKKG
jgi:hypothetical protein